MKNFNIMGVLLLLFKTAIAFCFIIKKETNKDIKVFKIMTA